MLAGHGDGMVDRGPLMPGRINHAASPMADVLAGERAEPAEALDAARIAEGEARIEPAKAARAAPACRAEPPGAAHANLAWTTSVNRPLGRTAI